MPNSSDKFDFAKALAELEAITTWFESDTVNLDEALAKFERGMALGLELKAYLKQVENRVEKIKRKFNDPKSAEVEESPPPEEPQLF